MVEIKYTRNLFLRCINVIYLCAFASLYVQIPGLYGKNGILPARTQVDPKGGMFDPDFTKQIQRKPTLLWFATYFGVDTEYMMDILALIGMLFSFTGFVSQKFCVKPVFSALWSSYYSLYQVGQTFMWFQWDVLLLEVGFLCIILAPWDNKVQKSNKKQPSSPSEHIRLWLVRWLLFRLLFSSGVVKLTSGCPTWWGLTALNVHFESMCIPSPLAWYSHHLPGWFLKLNTVFANFAEIIVPPLFFFPIRGVRIVAFCIQVFLQICIILTGNYNFFNYLTITLCLSLLDDDFFYKNTKNTSSWLSKMLKFVSTLSIYAAVIYATVILYGIKIMPSGIIESKITFTPADFEKALGRYILPAMIFLSSLSLLFTCIKSLGLVFSQNASKFGRLVSFLSTLFYVFVALFLFTDSMVPFSTLHPSGNMSFVPNETKELHNKISALHLTNAYGLFKRMTGVGGRPEIVIEGSQTMSGPWSEYNFKYKPGNVNDSLPFVAPHQPRLDWQMWFAALGTYHQNPWIMSLTYRLLSGQKEVLDLMDSTRNPFPNTPPKYIRANLYHYHYTSWAQKDKPATWTREKVSEYFPIFSKTHVPLLDYLKNLKILDTAKDFKPSDKISPNAIKILSELRNTVNVLEPPFLILSLLMTGFAIIIFSSLSPTSHHQTAKQQHQPSQTKGKKKNK